MNMIGQAKIHTALCATAIGYRSSQILIKHVDNQTTTNTFGANSLLLVTSLDNLITGRMDHPQQHDNYGTAGDGGSSGADSQQTLVCATCGASFKRKQELGRHIRSLHLPYWLFCSSPGCPWRGDRVDKLQRHKNTHNGQPTPVEEQECQIYNVKMILGFIRDSAGSDIITTAQRIAVDLVKERALEIGKQEWLEDPWGRSGRPN